MQQTSSLCIHMSHSFTERVACLHCLLEFLILQVLGHTLHGVLLHFSKYAHEFWIGKVAAGAGVHSQAAEKLGPKEIAAAASSSVST